MSLKLKNPSLKLDEIEIQKDTLNNQNVYSSYYKTYWELFQNIYTNQYNFFEKAMFDYFAFDIKIIKSHLLGIKHKSLIHCVFSFYFSLIFKNPIIGFIATFFTFFCLSGFLFIALISNESSELLFIVLMLSFIFLLSSLLALFDTIKVWKVLKYKINNELAKKLPQIYTFFFNEKWLDGELIAKRNNKYSFNDIDIINYHSFFKKINEIYDKIKLFESLGISLYRIKDINHIWKKELKMDFDYLNKLIEQNQSPLIIKSSELFNNNTQLSITESNEYIDELTTFYHLILNKIETLMSIKTVRLKSLHISEYLAPVVIHSFKKIDSNLHQLQELKNKSQNWKLDIAFVYSEIQAIMQEQDEEFAFKNLKELDKQVEQIVLSCIEHKMKEISYD